MGSCSILLSTLSASVFVNAVFNAIHQQRKRMLEAKLTNVTVRQVDTSLSWFFAVRALSLHGAANRDSPLLRSDRNLSLGAGMVLGLALSSDGLLVGLAADLQPAGWRLTDSPRPSRGGCARYGSQGVIIRWC